MPPNTYAIGRNTKYIPIPNRILKNKKVAHSRQNVPVCLAELLFERFSAKSVWVGAYKCSHFLTASACDIEVLVILEFHAKNTNTKLGLKQLQGVWIFPLLFWWVNQTKINNVSKYQVFVWFHFFLNFQRTHDRIDIYRFPNRKWYFLRFQIIMFET